MDGDTVIIVLAVSRCVPLVLMGVEDAQHEFMLDDDKIARCMHCRYPASACIRGYEAVAVT